MDGNTDDTFVQTLCCSGLQEAAASEVHTLPDGQSITINGQSITIDGQSVTMEGVGEQLAQALLNPSLLGKDLSDLPSATVTQIMQHPDGATRKVTALCCTADMIWGAFLVMLQKW